MRALASTQLVNTCLFGPQKSNTTETNTHNQSLFYSVTIRPLYVIVDITRVKRAHQVYILLVDIGFYRYLAVGVDGATSRFSEEKYDLVNFGKGALSEFHIQR